MKNLMTSVDLSEYLSVTMQTIYNWRNEGMPSIKVGSQYRYNFDDVMNWLEEKDKRKDK